MSNSTDIPKSIGIDLDDDGYIHISTTDSLTGELSTLLLDFSDAQDMAESILKNLKNHGRYQEVES